MNRYLFRCVQKTINSYMAECGSDVEKLPTEELAAALIDYNEDLSHYNIQELMDSINLYRDR